MQHRKHVFKHSSPLTLPLSTGFDTRVSISSTEVASKAAVLSFQQCIKVSVIKSLDVASQQPLSSQTVPRLELTVTPDDCVTALERTLVTSIVMIDTVPLVNVP